MPGGRSESDVSPFLTIRSRRIFIKTNAHKDVDGVDAEEQ